LRLLFLFDEKLLKSAMFITRAVVLKNTLLLQEPNPLLSLLKELEK